MKTFIITYFQYGFLKTKELQTDWFNFVNDCLSVGIYDYDIIKVELKPISQ